MALSEAIGGVVILKNELNNEKDKIIGKIKETAGKITNNDELEFKGKAQSIKGDIGSKTEDIKNKAVEKANNLIDKVRGNSKDKE